MVQFPPLERGKGRRILRCADCGNEYTEGMPHAMFCEAKTCQGCLTTFGSVDDLNEDGLCEDCAT